MPTIRIDEEVWEALQRLAKPFVDTPNDVLRRLPGLIGASGVTTSPRANVSGGRGRLKRAPEDFFRIPILEALVELGGRARVADVLDRVYERTKAELQPDDFKRLPKSGEERWRNTAMWGRKRMKDEGLLSNNSGHGYWEITEMGRRQLREQSR